MSMRLPCAVLLAVLLLGVVAPEIGAAEPDVSGSRDPFDVVRYPRSWIVEYHHDDDVVPRELIMSRVDRIRRELVIEERLRVPATLETVTYRIPGGASVDDVVDHYREAVGGQALFRCEGRGCGRSADWANQIFEQSLLYGPDRNQHYAAFEWQDRLVALYVNERGNQRVYAHLRFLDPPGEASLEPNALLARRLAERGWAVIEGVQPQSDGSFEASGQSVLTGLADRLVDFAGERLHLVCHLYGSGTDTLMTTSQRCAETAAGILAGAGEGAQTPELEAFGAGPLLPRALPPEPRLELVRPAALRGFGP